VLAAAGCLRKLSGSDGRLAAVTAKARMEAKWSQGHSTTIGNAAAFHGCTGLISITIPSTVTDTGAFRECLPDADGGASDGLCQVTNTAPVKTGAVFLIWSFF
jgi:hypothetical protein